MKGKLLIGLAASAIALTPAVVDAGRDRKIEPDYIDFELPGPNLFFFCNGSVGVYVTEGEGNSVESARSAAVATALSDPGCRG